MAITFSRPTSAGYAVDTATIRCSDGSSTTQYSVWKYGGSKNKLYIGANLSKLLYAGGKLVKQVWVGNNLVVNRLIYSIDQAGYYYCCCNGTWTSSTSYTDVGGFNIASNAGVKNIQYGVYCPAYSGNYPLLYINGSLISGTSMNNSGIQYKYKNYLTAIYNPGDTAITVLTNTTGTLGSIIKVGGKYKVYIPPKTMMFYNCYTTMGVATGTGTAAPVTSSNTGKVIFRGNSTTDTYITIDLYFQGICSNYYAKG